MIDIEDLTKEACTDNTAGIRQFVLYAYMDDIQSFPPSVPSSFSQIGSYTGDIVMNPAKGFKRLYCTLEMGDLFSDLAGSRDGKSFANKLEISHPGNEAQGIGFAEAMKNQDLVFLVPFVSGGYRVFGEPRFPARLDTATITSGKTTSDTKALNFVFECKGRAPKHFTGNVVPAPAEGGYVDDGYVDDDYTE